jgi:plastocyanin
MHKTLTIGVVLVGLGLLWSSSSVSGVQTAAAASPASTGDAYGMPYPMGPYGGTMPYPMNPYGGMMPYTGNPTSASGAYPMPMQVGATPGFGITVTAPAAAIGAASAGSPQGSSAVRIANFAFNPPATTVAIGQTVTWTNADMVAHTTTSDTGAWNSGPLQPGATFSQTFTTPGTFAYHCMIHPNMVGSISVVPSTATNGAALGTAAGTPLQTGGLSVTYAAGWDLVAGPTGTVLTGINGPLYTFRSGDTSYETVPAGSQLTAGSGYWAYFTMPETESLSLGGTQPGAQQLPAGRFVLIGNPGTTPMTVAGADSVLTYDASRGYQSVTMLQPGQGAWAISANGGTLTMAPTGSATVPTSGS